MKDYYQVLEIDVSASLQDIKKAYRRLAQQYHPDKNPDDPYKATQFSEIKEAYEVLTNPAKKEYYLEERWFHQWAGRKKTSGIVTPVSILKQTIDFDRHVSKLDVHRINKEGLYQYIKTELINEEAILKLNSFKDNDINQKIIEFILKNIFVIPSEQLGNFEATLIKINVDQTTHNLISNTINKQQKKFKKEKYRVLMLIAIVVAISLIIFFSSGK